MTTTYSYVKSNGEVANVDGENADSAIATAPNRDPHSGVVTPPYIKDTPTDRVNGVSQNPAVPSATRSPIARIDPSTFATGTFQEERDKGALTSGDLNEINNRYSDQLRREMDLINAKYAPKITDQTEENRKMLARTKVLNQNTGVTDSGTGVTAEVATEKKGSAALNAIRDEQNASLSQVMGKIDDLKFNEIQNATKQKKGDLENYTATREKNAQKASDLLKTYIQNGGNVDALRGDKKNSEDPNEQSSYDALSAALGGEGALQALAISYAPKDAFVSDKPEIIGNKAVWFKKGKDGTISQVQLDLPGDKEIKTVTRVPGEGTYVFYKDGTYEAIGHGGTTGSGNPKVVNEYVPKIKSTLNQYRGEDTYVDPYKYLDAYKAWTASGYKESDFVKNFPPKAYVSPEDNGLLPTILRTTAPKATDGGNPFK